MGGRVWRQADGTDGALWAKTGGKVPRANRKAENGKRNAPSRSAVSFCTNYLGRLTRSKGLLLGQTMQRPKTKDKIDGMYSHYRPVLEQFP